MNKTYTAKLGSESVTWEGQEKEEWLIIAIPLYGNTNIKRTWLTDIKEIDKETDWKSVPRGTKVLVNDSCGGYWKQRKFYAYDPTLDMPFLTSDHGGVVSWHQCKLAEPEKEEKVKEYWFNVYEKGLNEHVSMESANTAAGSNRLALWKITRRGNNTPTIEVIK
jgi:hypothetical protein